MFYLFIYLCLCRAVYVCVLELLCRVILCVCMCGCVQAWLKDKEGKKEHNEKMAIKNKGRKRRKNVEGTRKIKK